MHVLKCKTHAIAAIDSYSLILTYLPDIFPLLLGRFTIDVGVVASVTATIGDDVTSAVLPLPAVASPDNEKLTFTASLDPSVIATLGSFSNTTNSGTFELKHCITWVSPIQYMVTKRLCYWPCH